MTAEQRGGKCQPYGVSAYVSPDGTKRAPDAKFGKFHIYNRPHMTEFVEWASERFTVVGLCRLNQVDP